jgi:hypothetical protein
MEYPIGLLAACESDEKIHRVITNYHRCILTDLEKTREILLNLGRQH